MVFDPSTFLNQKADGPMSTSMPSIPEGDYVAMIDTEISEKNFSSFDSKKNGQTYFTASIPFVIQNRSDLEEQLGRKKLTVPMKVFLDIDEHGQLSNAKGKNVGLGRLREVLGQNTGAWSFDMLRGQGPLMIFVRHTPNEKDPESPYAEVYKVAKLS